MCNREKAIIIGGGISGKLAARVLSDFFKEVIILESDEETEGPVARKGARQGDHLHALLFAGENGLEELFPGITKTFHMCGAVVINSSKDLAWFYHGVWKLRHEGKNTTTLQSRPHLEWHIDQYIRKISNVSMLYRHQVKSLLYNQEENRVHGIKVLTSHGSRQTLTADIIVDASGVSSITTSFFKNLNLKIPIKKAQIGLSYVSKKFRLPPEPSRDWSIKIIYPNPPLEKLGGTLSKIEQDQYIVTLMGYQHAIDEKQLNSDEDGFLELTKKLPQEDIYNELVQAEPLSKTHVYRIPHMSWKRIEKVKQLPKGLFLIGDTVCRINPVFGQGMSIAVMEALALQKLFQTGSQNLDHLQTSFHKQSARILSPIWNMVLTEDLRYPGVIGKKPIGLPIQQWYTKKIFQLSATHEHIYALFIDVMNLVQPQTILLRPGIVKKVLMHHLFPKRTDG
ncbi:glutamate synthase subunit beta [Sporosarcina sp. BI001-red]|uniref:NAD(P)/FAD-dependent oxidoreductase n=1 Tax=Sporosarcina sp. BI001-red TaxID=2282866 RepID=UPI000E269DC1|nr:FAD-dependent monooxygenase [Sporosarcina sp. BI001-red]REB08765.1 glutamate synthase subunit beta [Sporosarcina sp. BI001-red]